MYQAKLGDCVFQSRRKWAGQSSLWVSKMQNLNKDVEV